METDQVYTVVNGRGTMTVFEIYIKTTPERLWEAITDDEMKRRYSFGVGITSEWTPGSSYRSSVPEVIDIAAGENLEVDPPRRLVQSFNALWSEEVKAEGTSRVTWEIAPVRASAREAQAPRKARCASAASPKYSSAATRPSRSVHTCAMRSSTSMPLERPRPLIATTTSTRSRRQRTRSAPGEARSTLQIAD